MLDSLTAAQEHFPEAPAPAGDAHLREVRQRAADAAASAWDDMSPKGGILLSGLGLYVAVSINVWSTSWVSFS